MRIVIQDRHCCYMADDWPDYHRVVALWERLAAQGVPARLTEAPPVASLTFRLPPTVHRRIASTTDTTTP